MVGVLKDEELKLEELLREGRSQPRAFGRKAYSHLVALVDPEPPVEVELELALELELELRILKCQHTVKEREWTASRAPRGAGGA